MCCSATLRWIQGRKVERRFNASNTIYFVYKNYKARQFKTNMRQAATVQQPSQPPQPLTVGAAVSTQLHASLSKEPDAVSGRSANFDAEREICATVSRQQQQGVLWGCVVSMAVCQIVEAAVDYVGRSARAARRPVDKGGAGGACPNPNPNSGSRRSRRCMP